MNGSLEPPTVEAGRTAAERIGFALGVLDILKGTRLFNLLIDRAIDDLHAVAAGLEAEEQKIGR